MKALLVYESMFGHTLTIAESIAAGMREGGIEVDLVEVGEAPAAPSDDVRFLVVGGPTHVFGLSRPETRASAASRTDEPLISSGDGLREWLEALPGHPGPAVAGAAAFDTHVEKRVPGTASRRVAKRLRHRGYRVVLPAESFFVWETTGPLLGGERERAHVWGRKLAQAALELPSPQLT